MSLPKLEKNAVFIILKKLVPGKILQLPCSKAKTWGILGNALNVFCKMVNEFD